MKPEGESAGLGGRLRRVRAERGLSLRELGRLAGCSASLISQVERGQTAPSAGVIYGIANALEISLDYLFGVADSEEVPAPAARGAKAPHIAGAPHIDEDGTPRFVTATATIGAPANGSGAARTVRIGAPEGRETVGTSVLEVDGTAPTGPALEPAAETIVQRKGRRRTIDLASGVRWERLTPLQDARVDFLEVVYAPYGRSTDTRCPIRHDGREYQLVLMGTLHADVGFETYVLEAGDSLAFDPATPHQYRNMTGEEVRAISVVVHHTD
ncbi:helix-turn-helix domain-containing protein [Streptomyces sp. NBC_00690]|uniref:helix-turn-helix domain-containing protein n=1 Tax=Streptomyces sp. NBC_00690 TaxID=2975808 RepID=UPI002E28929A|nr:helix-turn-helix domain-containing protein [Streptomyces sp. NBC_00690]